MSSEWGAPHAGARVHTPFHDYCVYYRQKKQIKKTKDVLRIEQTLWREGITNAQGITTALEMTDERTYDRPRKPRSESSISKPQD